VSALEILGLGFLAIPAAIVKNDAGADKDIDLTPRSRKAL